METSLPIFPLALVIYPNEQLNIHIFEPRYKQLINDSIEQGINFGIPPYIEGNLSNYGTEVELVKIHRIYANGEMDVTIKGIRIFKITAIIKDFSDRLYSAASVKWMKENTDSDPNLSEKIFKLVHELHETINVSPNKIPAIELMNTFSIAHYVGFKLEEEYELLCLRKEVERQKMIYKHLNKVIPILKETEKVRHLIQANGHFKYLQPPDF